MNEKFMTKYITLLGLATICCALWGSAPVCIKLGYELFQIQSSETMNILLFAGCRFTLAGFLVVAGYSLICRKPVLPGKTSGKAILALALSQTAVQYLLYYIGVAHASGVKASILSGSNTFFSVIIACLIFRQEKLNINKFLGCLAGVAGIVLINMTGAGSDLFSLNMSFLGEGFVLLSSLSGAVSAVLIRRFSQNNDAVMLSGYQFMTGGLMLIAVALAGGGQLTHVTGKGLLLLLYLALVSAVAYTLWSLLLKYNPVSRVTVHNFLMPIFGVILSTLILGEKGIFSMNTVGALLLVCIGIYLVNAKKKERN